MEVPETYIYLLKVTCSVHGQQKPVLRLAKVSFSVCGVVDVGLFAMLGYNKLCNIILLIDEWEQANLSVLNGRFFCYY